MSIIKAQAENIEREKLKAIGVRNKVKAEVDIRKRKLREFQQLISEKQNELERHSVEYDSLLKVEHDQKKLIERLSNNEPDAHNDDD